MLLEIHLVDGCAGAGSAIVHPLAYPQNFSFGVPVEGAERALEGKLPFLLPRRQNELKVLQFPGEFHSLDRSRALLLIVNDHQSQRIDFGRRYDLPGLGLNHKGGVALVKDRRLRAEV